jgi:transaldolase / glucose-6-phosphate isomerase
VRDGTLTVKALLPDAFVPTVSAALERARSEEVERRLRAADATLWAPAGTREVADRLGWLTIAERMLPQMPQLTALAEELVAEGVHDVVVLGMGGSSLAPEVIRRAFGALRAGREGHAAAASAETADGERHAAAVSAGAAGAETGAAPRLHVLDSTDAAAVRALESAVELERTLFLVSSKSGGTIEPLSMFAHFWSRVPEGDRFAAITDPGTGLDRLAAERRFRRVFHGDPEIGGRYSALSPFGIVPAVLGGADANALLQGSKAAWETPIAIGRQPAGGRAFDGRGVGEPTDAPAWLWLGVALSALANEGRDKLSIVTPASLDGLGLWLEQLFAESTGKHGRGVLPVAQEPLLRPEAYGEDRVFLVLTDPASLDPDAELALSQLSQAGHPLIAIPTQGAHDLGRIFMLAELCVSVAGWGLSINPFDQPNVQEAKDATAKVLAEIEARSAPAPPPEATEEELRDLIGDASPPSYVALMGYMKPSREVDAAIGALRAAIMAATRASTTFGYGPRFLHSTGQFHKGGPPTGRFLQLLHDSGPDVAVPGRAYTFTALKHAQADGDLQTLRAHRLPAARLTLRADDDPSAALHALAAQIGQWAQQTGQPAAQTGQRAQPIGQRAPQIRDRAL